MAPAMSRMTRIRKILLLIDFSFQEIFSALNEGSFHRLCQVCNVYKAWGPVSPMAFYKIKFFFI